MGAPFPDDTWVRTEVSTAPPGSRMRKAAWITLGGAIALGAVSAVLTRDSYDLFIHRVATEGSFDQAKIREVQNFRLSTNLLLAGAVGAGALGVLLLWLSDSPTSPGVAFGPGPDFTFMVRF